ncbi:MAG: ribosome-associated translation inhibitor RaiA [Euryarchaeota archaeon]|nr:ribosome-associated translation inhibitor RaiA [Euryarchaeota archaeon]
MQITITDRSSQLTGELQEYARRKLEGLEHIWNRLESVRLIVETEGSDFTAEVNLRAAAGQLNTRNTHSDLHVALDGVVKKTEQRLKKMKDKFQNQRKHRSAEPAGVVPPELPRLIREEGFEVKTMMEREATFKMRASTYSFLIYRDDREKKLRVIFRRRDGNLGLIEL